MPDNLSPSISRIADLQQFIANFAKVQRKIHLADAGRFENDVEHSYSLALTCWFIAPKLVPQLDLQKILMYALAHDTVEIYSGDTFVFDQEKSKTKSDREDAAIEQLKADWPDFPELAQAAREYKDKANPEARFVYTTDKMLPIIMVNLGEKEAFWQRHKITREMAEAAKAGPMSHSPEGKRYFEALRAWIANPDYFYKGDATVTKANATPEATSQQG